MTCKCGAETSDGIFICHACCARLEQLLCELDSIVQDLVSAIPRASLTASYGERVSSSGSLHAPLPVNEVALDAHIALDRYLMRTCLELTKVTGTHLSRRDSTGLASYLLANMRKLRAQDWAGTVEGELSKLLRECEDVTRVHEQQVFAGTCQECETDLYARKGEDMARCRTCGLSYEVARWTAYAQTAKDYYIGTAADLSRKLSAPQYGYLITADQIRKWATRGKLDRANPDADEDGKPIPPAYRLGDVLGLRIERYKQFPINGAA
jgi:ribosomal protein L37AE/L43A